MLKQLFAKKSISQLLDETAGEKRLHQVLGPIQLTALGVSMVIGAGIFIRIGEVARDQAGPAVIISFVVAGITCILAALCYAEFAAMVPIAGSAYTYTYASLGELLAWIIGWDLILEYAVVAAAVGHGASDYFQSLIGIFNLQLPDVLTDAPFRYDANQGGFILTGKLLALPALLMTLGITLILIKGIRESAGFNVAMVILKIFIVIFIIVAGASYVIPANWQPFVPYGGGGIVIFGTPVWGELNGDGKPVGILAGAATIFFAYIGFDSVSNHSEEARNPRRDIPIGIIASLFICSILYIGVGAVLTGMVPYNEIAKTAPIAAAFGKVGMVWAEALISLGAVIAIMSVMLVTMLSQTRILMAMGRGGLLPGKFFSAVNQRTGTPLKSTILTGLFVALLSSLLPFEILADLINIGTLLAFLIVCAGVLILRRTAPHAERPFRTPFVPLVPVLGILTCLLLMFSLPAENWLRLGIWLIIGLVIYFAYGRRHSVMHRTRT